MEKQPYEQIIEAMHESYKRTGNKDEVGKLCKEAYAKYKVGELSSKAYDKIYYAAMTIGTNR
ncbi:hypothetical protein [Bacillus mesophilum]|uniref:Uncharacterized protein n=1 Tax=Bacillus mesophilum TaxID=1071718 RepID=A0A7V7RNL7_9BACI|nr:hypothetical protein [Bacillus mesophilum]KAB2333622.1 hypothetical protein F7732_05905 [Bacillus mesophilum]